jgi:hypothetical protein
MGNHGRSYLSDSTMKNIHEDSVETTKKSEIGWWAAHQRMETKHRWLEDDFAQSLK